MARKLASEANPAELEELERLVRVHPQYQAALDLTQAYWNQHPDTPLTDKEIEAALDKILHKEEHDPVWEEWQRSTRRRRIRRRQKAIIVAATVAAAAAGVLLWPRHHDPPKIADTEVQTRPGTRSNLLLPDGTVVWLNAGSNLTYPPAFNGKTREVELSGEAFFDVAKNPEHPFIVHTASMNIRVLGTSFDVKAYEQDKTTETTLIKGSIEVTLKSRPDTRIILQPNQKLVIPIEDSVATPVKSEKPTEKKLAITPPTIDIHTGVIIETAWTTNKLVFQDESFRDLAAQMERWYGITVVFDKKPLEDLRFTGSFEKETIQQALAALQLTADFTYTIHENQITIYER
jgi:ferric-dicitrate binding protein FerR (iron transport regulator)